MTDQNMVHNRSLSMFVSCEYFSSSEINEDLLSTLNRMSCIKVSCWYSGEYK